jgi:hypothetical protein
VRLLLGIGFLVIYSVEGYNWIVMKHATGDYKLMNGNQVGSACQMCCRYCANHVLGERKERLLKSLSSYDYKTAFKQARQKRYSTTCSWLAQTSEFRDWLDDAQPSCFWCYGIREYLA